jgi:type I restriction-modification system DNA methylase subunit
MTKEQLKAIFQSSFDLEAWQQVLIQVFGVTQVRHTPKEIVSNESKKIKGFELGTLKTSDNYEIGLYVFEIGDSTNVELNRVGLRSLVSGYTKYGVDAAITVYYDKAHWRLSFICDLKQEKTAPKRFTYAFGSSQETYRTATDRLYALFGNASFASIRDAFSVEALSKQFYGELSDWYFWALTQVKFPSDLPELKDKEFRNATMTIRLITRLMFVWFLKKKGIIPECLFDKSQLDEWLLYKDLCDSTYYKAILQNLFFATLNLDPKENPREFVDWGKRGVLGYRYKRFFKKGAAEQFIQTCKDIPFLNGGLFENLDKDVETEPKRVDCFSNCTENEMRLAVPDALFFGEEQSVDLSRFYDDRRKSAVKVKGLFEILKSYNFTVEENTPYEKDVALDPELLGQIFENLLASYNPETKTTARKQTGSFYTPREIVQYMVDESIIAYLKNNVDVHLEDEYRKLTRYTAEDLLLTKVQKKQIATALFESKILDPACGSGAYPMGILQKMVHILNQVDSDNRFLYEMTTQKAMKDCSTALREDSEESMEDKLVSIGRLFDETRNRPDYVRKLHLIENCIYGVDIQPVAVQISKLRFFISLVVEQNNNDKISPLPNLETNFVAADTLIGIDKPADMMNLKDEHTTELEERLRAIRHEHFFARRTSQKKKCRDKDKLVREELKNHLISLATGIDESRIAQAQATIHQLQMDREKVKEEKWGTVRRPKQASLFGDDSTDSELDLRVDLNKEKRDAIDHLIRVTEQRIRQEYAKADNNAFTAEANRLAQWNPYDQNATSGFFDPEWMFGIKDGFDVVIGNPPYVQLQANGGELANKYQSLGYETFDRTGDLYCLFYEKAHRLLKANAHLCFITSNKWMRAGYGEAMRSFLAAKTNPISLIDFAGQKIFESATVDTNILLFKKTHVNAGKTQSCIATASCRDNLSDFVRHQANVSTFNSADSWIILNSIEKSIKDKIEGIGIPLKDWDIQINYGIKTGFNGPLENGGCFIITDLKRKEILANCRTQEEKKRTDELIRPILRGRDIRRYGYDFADIYIIASHNGTPEKGVPRVDIEKYPAIKRHFDSYWKQLANRSDMGDTPYNLRSCAYMEDFNKQKIVWGEISDKTKFALDATGKYYTEATTFLMTGENLPYLVCYLNSSLSEYLFSKIGTTTGVGTVRWKKFKIEQLYIPVISEKLKSEFCELLCNAEKREDLINAKIFEICNLSKKEIEYITEILHRC